MKTFIQSIKIIAVALILTSGVSAVYADMNNAPLFTGTQVQEKAGHIWSKKLLGAPIGLFKKSLFLPGKNASLRIGSGSQTGSQEFSGQYGNVLNTMIFNGSHTEPVVLDLDEREPKAIKYINTESGQCTVATRWTTDASAFEFKKSDETRANIIARQVRLTAGSPRNGSVLVSDAAGNARWAKPTVQNGVVVFGSDTSPVPNGWSLMCSGTPPTPTDLCANIDGTQTILPPDTTQSGSDCVCNVGYTMSGDGVCIEDGDSLGAPPIGCFLADTQVTLADGSKKDIQDVKVGDRLKAVSGINTVQKLLRPILNDNPAYSINGSDAFFTANHPFLTTDGWKSLDPETTRKEIPDLKVSLMNVGDVLVTESGIITIHSITPANQPANTQLYNFELDGDHTYYANGYAVHNKEQVPPNNPNPSCDFNTSTPQSDCTELNWYYCAIPNGNTQGQCIPSRICTTDAQCASGPTIGSGPDQIQLVNGRCLLPISAVHPADQGKKFCYWN
jgi:hypothetical protein